MDKQTGLERESMVIKGVRSELRLEGGQIHITKGSATQATPSNVTFGVAAVRGSTVEVPRRGGRGWLHIATVNGSPAPVGEMAASGDPFALPITKGQVPACRKLAKLIDRHVKERGMPADVGPNQGRFTSGVVVSQTRAPVAAPMVTMPVAPTSAAAAAQEESSADGPAEGTVAKKAASKRAVASKPAAKKATKKRAAAAKPPAKRATAKRTAPKKTAATRSTAQVQDSGRAAAASELVAQLRELGELHAAGVLDAAEFAAAKAKILG